MNAVYCKYHTGTMTAASPLIDPSTQLFWFASIVLVYPTHQFFVDVWMLLQGSREIWNDEIWVSISETYWERTFSNPLTIFIFTKNSILDVWYCSEYASFYHSDVLSDLVPLVQFKKRKKHLRGSVNFLKLYKWYQITLFISRLDSDEQCRSNWVLALPWLSYRLVGNITGATFIHCSRYV